MTTPLVGRLHARLVDQLRERLDIPSQWREALTQTPRHLFLPDRVWQLHGAELIPVDRRADPQRWLEAAYSPDPIVTQLDAQQVPTSSCSMPYLVLRMLELLDIHPEHRVLEIGTGTGWNAALLARQVGDHQVVTVEVDPQVAEHARTALARADARPRVVVGDGAQGWAPGAPYDRVIATCATYRVPYPWVEQTRTGGVIVTPWDSPLGLGGLLRLTVADGAASGPFTGDASFMWLRGQQFDPPDEPDAFASHACTSTLTVDLAAVRENTTRFVIGMLVPDCRAAGFYSDDEIWLLAQDAWASVEVTTGIVRQFGNRRLWDEVEAAYRWWTEAGRPELTRFGLTVTCDRQWTWLDHPDNPLPTHVPAG